MNRIQRCFKALAASVLTLMLAPAIATGSVLWSEDFEGFATGDLPSQDSTWSYTNTAGISPWVDVGTRDGSQRVFVGGSTASSANHSVTAQKDLAAEFDTSASQMEVSFVAETNVGLPSQWGHQGAFRLWSGSDDLIAYIFFREQPTTGAVDGWFNDATITFPTGTNDYRFGLDFVQQQASLYINDVLIGQEAFMSSVAPGDLAALDIEAGLFFPSAADRNTSVVVDDIVVIPEPGTVGLLAVGLGLLGLRRRRR